jgi:SPP1 gp7 family putative phage head morphogenesis protein
MDPQIKTAGKMYREFAKQSATETMANVRDVLLRDVLRNPDARLRDVKESLRRVGITGGEDDGIVQTLVRTQRSIVAHAKMWLNTIDDPRVWGYEYRTKHDKRVRPDHEALEGVRYPKRHPFWKRYAPPNGWNCRCVIVPVYRWSRKARTKPFRGTPDVDPEFLWNPGYALVG